VALEVVVELHRKTLLLEKTEVVALVIHLL
jgi:hypothetical protein